MKTDVGGTGDAAAVGPGAIHELVGLQKMVVLHG
jgi:hypothetical protein